MRLSAALMATSVVVVQALLDDEQKFAGHKESKYGRLKDLHWNLEESLERQNLVKGLVEGLSENPMWPHRDSFAEYDHGLMQEHMPMRRGHSGFYAGGPQSMYPDAHGYGDYRDYRNGIFRHAECFADQDCA